MHHQQPGPQPVRVIGIFDDKQRAGRFVEQLIERDFAMDQISLLHQGGGHGDDPLGVVYRDDRERIKVWGEQGVLWGALGGLLAGLSGVFLVPEMGAVLAAGPVVDALIGAITGAATMAGAAAVTSVSIALRRLGIPDERLQELEQAIQEGQYLLLLHTESDQAERLAIQLRHAGAVRVLQV